MSIVVGIDAHLDSLAAARSDRRGRIQGTMTVANTKKGWQQLWKWGGDAQLWAIEGAGAYGQAAARWLIQQGAQVREVPTRLSVAERWRQGRSKADEADAIACARAALREELPPVSFDAELMALRMMVTYRQGLRTDKTRIINRLRRLIATIDPQRAATMPRIRGVHQLQNLCRFPTHSTDPTPNEVVWVIRRLASQALQLHREISQTTRHISRLLPKEGWALTQIDGIGIIGAATLISHIGDIRRFKSKAALAMWAGAAPLDASSGRQQRHRLNRFGNRQVNSILHIAICNQLRRRQAAHHYITHRLSQGKTKREAIRSAKRHLTRTIWTTLTNLT